VLNAKMRRMYRFCVKVLGMKDEHAIVNLVVHDTDRLHRSMETHNKMFAEPYDLLHPNSVLTNLLGSVKARLWVMTNSSLYARPAVRAPANAAV
jgi:hypothetical protein